MDSMNDRMNKYLKQYVNDSWGSFSKIKLVLVVCFRTVGKAALKINSVFQVSRTMGTGLILRAK